MRATLDRVAPTPAIHEPEPLLDIEQAARFLNVSETSLRRWTNDGRLACLRVGRRRERRFRREDLLAFLEGEPGGRRRSSAAAAQGMHLCGLYSSLEGQVRQALSFLAEGFPPGTVTYLVGTAETRGRILEGLERAHPDIETALAEGRLVVGDYAGSAAAQLAWWEARIGRAVAAGATLVRAIGDAGGFIHAASREELLHYEAEFDRRIVHCFPVVAMCQYDVRQFSGLLVHDALRVHPHCFGQPAERILA